MMHFDMNFCNRQYEMKEETSVTIPRGKEGSKSESKSATAGLGFVK